MVGAIVHSCPSSAFVKMDFGPTVDSNCDTLCDMTLIVRHASIANTMTPPRCSVIELFN